MLFLAATGSTRPRADNIIYMRITSRDVQPLMHQTVASGQLDDFCNRTNTTNSRRICVIPLPHRYPSYQLQRSEEHTSELQSLMRISYTVFCLKKKKKT